MVRWDERKKVRCGWSEQRSRWRIFSTSLKPSSTSSTRFSTPLHFSVPFSDLMRGGFLLKAVLFLLVSHAVILFCIYEFPGLAHQLEAFLPVNATLSAAMAAAAGMRPTFLTRTLVFSNPNHRAGKPCRRDTAHAYRVFIELQHNIRRSLDPYRISTKSIHSPARASATAASTAIPHLSTHCGVFERKREELPTRAKYLRLGTQQHRCTWATERVKPG